MKIIRLGGEIDPLAVSGPRAREAHTTGRANDSDLAFAQKRHHPARKNLASTVHLNDKDRAAIRRKIGMMDHTSITRRSVNIATVPSRFIRGHKDHMQSFSDLRKQQPLPTF